MDPRESSNIPTGLSASVKTTLTSGRAGSGYCSLHVSLAILLVLLAATRAVAQPGEGFLDIKTVPAGATIVVDRIERGTAPAFLTLNPGRHTLEITASNFESQTIEVVIKEKEITKQVITLVAAQGFRVKPGQKSSVQQAKGKLTVISDPPGAQVYLDGERVEVETPMTLEEVGAGWHDVRVAAFPSDVVPAEFEIAKRINVRANQTQLLRVNLSDYVHLGTLFLHSPRGGQEVTVKFSGSSWSRRLEVPSETHLLAGRYDLIYAESAGATGSTSETINGLAVAYEPLEEAAQTLPFTILGDRQTAVSFSGHLPLLRKLKLGDHPGYQSLEDYEAKHFAPLPESEIVRRPDGLSLLWRGSLTALGVVLMATESSDQTGEQKNSQRTWGAVIAVAGGVAFGLELANPEPRTVPLPENGRANVDQKARLKHEYEQLVAGWQSAIDAVNRQIDLRNAETLRRNGSTLRPEVTYR